MRDTARRRESRKWALGIWRPIASGLRHLDEARAKRKRRVASEVGDDKHFVAQRRHQEQVHLGEDPRHFLGDLPAKPVGLDEVNRRQKSRLAKRVGPGIGNLNLKLIETAAEGQFFEGGSRFRKEYQIEGVIRPARNRQLDGGHAELSYRLQIGTVYVGGGIFLHPTGKVTHAEILHLRARIEVQPPRRAR